MLKFSRAWLYAAALVGTAMTAPELAIADTVVSVSNEGNLLLSQSWMSTAAGQTPTTVTGTGANDSVGPVQISDLTGNGPQTSNYFFNQSFTSPSGSYDAATTLGNGNQFGFIDSYVIDLPQSAVGAYIFSLNMTAQSGLDNLTARLYEYNANGVQNLTLGVTGPISLGLVDAWSASANGYVASTTLSPTNLSGGYYVLEVAGLEVGSNSGGFSGQLSVTPVPLPGGLQLLLGGLAMMGAVLLVRPRSDQLTAAA